MTIRAYLWIALVLSSYRCWAQTPVVRQGQVVDQATREPIAYAVLQLIGTSHGIVTNAEGQYVLRLDTHQADSVAISSLGYAPRRLALAQWQDGPIELTEKPIELAHVLVTDATPESLLRQAAQQFASNHPLAAQAYQGFYREVELWKDASFANIRSTEAVLDLHRPGTSRKELKAAQFRVRKARQMGTMDDSSAQEFRDLASMKGGPYRLLESDLDAETFDSPLFNPDHKEYRNYRHVLDGIVTREGRDTYVISFAWQGAEPAWRPTGKIYIDAETKAIAGYDYELPPDLRVHGPGMSLLGIAFRAQDLVVGASFRYAHGKWVPMYLRRGVAARIMAKNEKREQQFRAKFGLGKEFDVWYYAEYFITDAAERTAPLPAAEVLREKDRMAAQRTDPTDAFWAGYSYSPPSNLDWLMQRK